MIANTELLFAAGVAGVVLVAILLIQAYASKLKAAEQARLSGSSADDSGEFTRPQLPEENPGAFARLDSMFEQAVGRTGMDISPGGTLAFIAFCGIALGGVVHFWKDNLLLTAAAALLGMAVPLGTVMVLQARYRKQFQEQLPDALYALSRSLRAGLSLEQAVEAYAKQGTKPVADEFGRVVTRVRLGMTTAAALESVAVRVKLLDFNVFVSTVALYRQTGGNLALLLDRLAASVRDRNQFRGRFMAATAQARIVAIILALFGPVLLIGYAIWDPGHVQAFFNSPVGWMILAGCFALELIGAVWMWRILKVDY